MCDYSLMAIPNRVAVCGDELVVHRFQTGSLGPASASDLRKGQDRLKVQRHDVWQKQLFNPSDPQSPPAICIPTSARLLVQDIPSKYSNTAALRRWRKRCSFRSLSMQKLSGCSPISQRR